MTANVTHPVTAARPERAGRAASAVSAVRAAVSLLALLAVAGVALAVGPVAVATDRTTTDDASTDDVTWTVRTASNGFGSDRTAFGYGLDPGASADDALVVANRGDEPLVLAVYAAAGYTTDAGLFDVRTAGTEPTGLGAWLETATDTLTVGPGETAEVPFTIAVPDDATPGDYAGAVITSLAQGDQDAGITVDRRLGIRVDLRVGGELAPSLAVEDPQVRYHGTANPAGTGTADVSWTLHNTGNTVVSAQQSATVSGPFGLLAVDAASDALAAAPDLLPGESWTVTVPVTGVAPAIRLGADVTVTPVLTDAAGSTSALAPVYAVARTWAVPWMTLAVVLLVLAAAVLLPRLARRRRRVRAAAEDRRVAEAVAQALRDHEGAGVAGTP